MTGVRAERVASVVSAETLLAERLGVRTGNRPQMSPDRAMRISAVWAALRLRADLVSTMPIDVYRTVEGVRVDVPTPPPVLVTPGGLYPGGTPVSAHEWLYATQVDLDRSGNAFGLITARDGTGRPARIDLLPLSDVVVKLTNGELHYLISGQRYEPHEVWHERQYPAAGLPVGLSPVAHAALSLGEYDSAQQLAIDWFGSSAIPVAHLKNSAKTLKDGESQLVADRYHAQVESGGLFVTGSDWEFHPIQAATAQADYIEVRRHGVTDIARFFGVPVDLIDAAVAGSSITYASLTQRNLQFLIMHLGPTVIRREDALSSLTPRPRFVKLNTDALLRMDPETRAQTIATQINSRVLAPSEARRLDDRLPFTDDQLAEFDRLFPAPPKTTTGVSS